MVECLLIGLVHGYPQSFGSLMGLPSAKFGLEAKSIAEGQPHIYFKALRGSTSPDSSWGSPVHVCRSKVWPVACQ